MSFNPHGAFDRIKLAVAGLLLLGLAACAQPFKADVSRFQSQLPPPSDETFTVVPNDPAMAGGIEFRQYADLVTAKLSAYGYTPIEDPESADLLIRFDYGVDEGRDRIRANNFYHDPFWSPWYGYGPYGYWGRPYRPGLWGYGWYDPWLDNGVETYTVYTSGVSVEIDRRVDGTRLFEGRAEAVSTSNRLQYLVPNLVEAMFTNFPGNSGETVRISVAPEKSK